MYKDDFREAPELARVIIVTDLTLQAAEGAFQHIMPSKVSISRIKENICACTEQHKKSCALQVVQPPSHLKVIDCERRLVIDAPADCDYVALSYVWGNQDAIESFSSIRDLPRTIEHSIIVTLELGYKYLWIDRYVGRLVLVSMDSAKSRQCINQQDEQHRDNQILQMSSIYHSAQITIVAAAGASPAYGLPGVGSFLRQKRIARHARFDSLSLSLLHLARHTKESYLGQVARSFWASRAWTYQEGMFSMRRLIFTKRQVIFSCNETTNLESNIASDYKSRIYLPWIMVSNAGEYNKRMGSAKTCLEQYCRRNLSHESDALNAIVSSLNLVLRHDEYHIWGVPFQLLNSTIADEECPDAIDTAPPIWELVSPPEYVMICLLWSNSTWYFEEDIPFYCRRLRFPSWSPLGWSPRSILWEGDGMITSALSLRTANGSSRLSEHLQCAKTDPSRMPQQLELTTMTMTVGLCEGQGVHDWPWNDVVFTLGEGFEIRKYVMWDDHKTFLSDTSIVCGDSLKVAIVVGGSAGTVHLLLLKSKGSYYERVGFCKFLAEPLGMLLLRCEAVYKVEKQTDTNPLGREAGKAELETCFGNLDEYRWWDHLPFQEETIVLG